MNINVEQIKKDIPIRDIISQYTEIKKNKAKCIFHSDSKPSLQIYEDTNTWFCWVCGVGGDVIKFIELAENVDFIEAIKKLTGEDNIQFNYKINYNHLSSKDLIEIIDELKDMEQESIFDERLVEEYARKQHKYLLEQGYEKSTLEYFKVGFCYDNSELHNRITFAWYSVDNKLVGIVGRDVTNKSDIKYIAKRGSQKQNHLFNLNNAKYHAHNGLILVEDEKSVMRLYQFGFKNAVALGNSSLNGRKWLLRKFTNKVYLALDNDRAGKLATKKIERELKPLMITEIIELPKGYKDIAEIKDRKVWLNIWKKIN